MNKINCIICNKLFYKRFSRQKTCSEECSKLYVIKRTHEYYLRIIDKHKTYAKIYKQQHPEKFILAKKYMKKCIICKKNFIHYKQVKCCSMECRKKKEKIIMKISGQKFRNLHKRQKILIKCNICGKDFYGNKNDKNCSIECRRLYHKIKRIYGRRLWEAINFGKKQNHTLDYMGCSIQQLKEYLEKQFRDGMNWNNYTYWGWHVDHIIPCCAFDLSKEEEIYKCFHYTNLQPLWWYENISKGSKILNT